MGCFSWMFANAPERNLKMGHKAYVVCPTNELIAEPCYEGYGEFDGKDVYDLVADWNREYLSEHPEFLVTSFGREIPVSRFDWYRAYADLTLSREEVVQKVHSLYEWRVIGINIACECNYKLPFPIKIVSTKCDRYGRRWDYEALPYSDLDPDQGA